MNPELLRSTLETVLERESAITPRFYQILFTRYPQVRPLFGGNSSKAQEEMLQRSLIAVVDNLENASWLTSTLSALGAKHVAYGVTREMFDWVGDALLTALSEVLDEQWSDAVAMEWAEAYGVIRDLMLTGMREAVTPPRAPESASYVS